MKAPMSEPTNSFHDASSDRDSSRNMGKCGSHGWSFLVHTDPSFGDVCCRMCEQSCGGRHGKKCEQRAYQGLVTAMPVMPVSEVLAFRSGAIAVRDWHDTSVLGSLAVKRGDRFRAAEPREFVDGSWLYVWRGDGREGWVPYMALSPASFAPALPHLIAV